MPKKPKMELVQEINEPPASIAKPEGSSLDRFKSKRSPTIAGVATLLTALPHMKIGEVNDWARLHPDEAKYWSDEFCFVVIPIKGQKNDLVHLIVEELAEQYLSGKRIQRYRLALASKPHDVFFLCHVPSRNLDNNYNATAREACELAKTKWVQATSRKGEGVDAYKIDFARDQDAFPEPNWPKQSLDDLINVTFKGRMIVDENDPSLLRLIGAKQI